MASANNSSPTPQGSRQRGDQDGEAGASATPVVWVTSAIFGNLASVLHLPPAAPTRTQIEAVDTLRRAGRYPLGSGSAESP